MQGSIQILMDLAPKKHYYRKSWRFNFNCLHLQATEIDIESQETLFAEELYGRKELSQDRDPESAWQWLDAEHKAFANAYHNMQIALENIVNKIKKQRKKRK